MQIQIISGSDFPKKTIPLIDNAQQSIDIIVFDWRWYPQDPGAQCQLFNQAIVRASNKKVVVRAIANNDQVIEILKSVGVNAKRLISTKLMHCKLMIIDKKIVITGSHNYTQSAFQMNFELSVILDKLENTNEFDQYFENLWTR